VTAAACLIVVRYPLSRTGGPASRNDNYPETPPPPSQLPFVTTRCATPSCKPFPGLYTEEISSTLAPIRKAEVPLSKVTRLCKKYAGGIPHSQRFFFLQLCCLSSQYCRCTPPLHRRSPVRPGAFYSDSTVATHTHAPLHARPAHLQHDVPPPTMTRAAIPSRRRGQGRRD
jgi:hypothetical protein